LLFRGCCYFHHVLLNKLNEIENKLEYCYFLILKVFYSFSFREESRLRLAIVDEQKHNGEEFKHNLNRMNAVLDNKTGFDVKMLSSEIKEASGEISQILGQLDDESDKERASVEAFGAKLRATRDELKKELEEENQYRTASIDLNLDEETQKEEENSLKRQRIVLWNKHDRTLRGVVKDDRAEKKDRITARATLLEAWRRFRYSPINLLMILIRCPLKLV
jgi:hypothetical protein